MDGLFILIGLVVLAIPIAVIALLIGQSGLRARVAVLERRLAAVEAARTGVPDMPLPAPDVDGPLTAPDPETDATPAPAPPATAAPAAADPVAASPWPAAAAPDAQPAGDAGQDRPIVLRSDRFAALAAWLRENWVYAVSGLSLALAGIFLVQWGIERGMIPPGLRILAGLAFGGALVMAGEWLRRRHGAGDDDSLAYLPAVFAGAGVVSLFAAVVAARQLYGLIGPTPGFIGLVAVAGLAVSLGWRHGPLLAALGLSGAVLAPFLVGGGAADTGPLHLYFTLVAGVGLAVDALRRWAWISVLALVLSFGAGVLIQSSGTADLTLWIVQLVLLPLLAATLPELSLWPAHPGPTVAEAILRRPAPGDEGRWPTFPTRLAAGTLAASAFGLATLPLSAAGDLAAYGALALLALAFSLWAHGARGLSDLAALPAAGFLVRAALQMADWTLAADFLASGGFPPAQGEGFWPVIAMAAAISGGFALRALRDGAGRIGTGYGFAAVVFAPALLLLVEVFWRADAGWPLAYPWAVVIMAHAAGATFLALAFARADGEARRRLAHAALAALSLIALALFVLTTKAALTLALGVLLAAAAALDRRFRLPEFAGFIQLGLMVLLYRLAVDPGLFWSLEGPLWQMVLAHAGALAGILAAWVLLDRADRPQTRVALSAGAATVLALFVSVCLARWLTRNDDGASLSSHWGATLLALPWLLTALSQAVLALRPGAAGRERLIRLAVTAIAAILALFPLGWALVGANPLLDAMGGSNRVLGPPVADSLLLAYAVPGLILILAARFLPKPPVLRLAGAAYLLLWAGLEIRRIVRGPDLTVPGVSQPEQYAYTIALTLLGAGLLWQAIARGSPGLRRLAMAVIGLTAAKVFLIDGAQLTGLMRVFSFLGLGLALAGLAWLNRWAALRSGGDGPPPEPAPPADPGTA